MPHKVTACCRLVTALMLVLLSCRPNANLQTPGTGFLQGQWQQQPEAIHQQLVNYTLYNFKFSCDSFYVTMQMHSKVNYGADTCMASGQWTEYAKGHYQQQNDTLWMKGYFCNPDYTLKELGGCFRSGVYEQYFRAKKKADTLVTLTNTADVVPVNLHLVKRISCIPKPL